MNNAPYVDEQIQVLKNQGIPLSNVAWKTALMCVGWPYVFGDRGQNCTPANRRTAYNRTSAGKDKDNIKNKCKNFEGGGTCSGCKWFPENKRVRDFDCRGFTYWVLKAVFGWELKGAGCTSQWNEEKNWKAKGSIADGIPQDVIVCLFYHSKTNPKVMEHTGLYYNGETCECSNGVQHFTSLNKKWDSWAVPVCVSGDIPTPSYPILRKGSKGTYVTLLQTQLMNRGYSLPKYGADGSFGNETLTAVKQFQSDNGLTADGVVGEKTWAALESATEKKKTYKVVIPNRTKEEAEALLKQYPGTMTLE